MLIDEVAMLVESGHGWQRLLFLPAGEIRSARRSDGGDGGDGGDVVFVVDPQLARCAICATGITSRRAAENTDRKNKTGMRGEDAVIRVPPGTILKSVRAR